MDVDPADVRDTIRNRPLRRVRAELICLLRTVRPTEDNHLSRKIATGSIITVWALIELGSAFGWATPPPEFFHIRLGVGLLVGRMWGIEINNVAGVELDYPSDEGDDGGG